MIALVLLRLSIGCHFLYEGIWKIENADKFTADPFLSEAKGIAAPLFYAMLDDLDGRERLVVSYPEVTPADGETAVVQQTDLATVTSPRTVDTWRAFGEMLKGRMGPVKDENVVTPYDKEKLDAEKTALTDMQKPLVEEQKALHDAIAKGTADEKSVAREAELTVKLVKIASRISLINEYHALVAEQGSAAESQAAIRNNKELPPKAKQQAELVLLQRMKWVDQRVEWLSRQQRLADLQQLIMNGKATPEELRDATVLKRKQWVDLVVASYEQALQDYLDINSQEIAAHFINLDKFEKSLRGMPGTVGTDFEKKREWDKKGELREVIAPWIKEIETQTNSLKATCFSQCKVWDAQTEIAVKDGSLKVASVKPMLTPSEVSAGKVIPGNWWNPLTWTRSEQMSFMVTWMLTLIGIALFFGCCTRLASIGGAIFMLMIVLTQLQWPAWYPPSPAVVGHAMIINKDFIEMMALIVLATVGAGRWGGVDSVLWTLWKMLPCNRAKAAETKAAE